MTKLPKYGNVKVQYDLDTDKLVTPFDKPTNRVVFDSMLEYNVYCLIRMVVKKECISIHKPLPIWEATNMHPKFDWCVDFTIHLSKGDLYVEAKGISTADFIYRLRAIDYVKPELLDKMLFVTQLKRKVVGKGKYSIWSIEPNDLPETLSKMIKQLEGK